MKYFRELCANYRDSDSVSERAELEKQILAAVIEIHNRKERLYKKYEFSIYEDILSVDDEDFSWKITSVGDKTVSFEDGMSFFDVYIEDGEISDEEFERKTAQKAIFKLENEISNQLRWVEEKQQKLQEFQKFLLDKEKI